MATNIAIKDIEPGMLIQFSQHAHFAKYDHVNSYKVLDTDSKNKDTREYAIIVTKPQSFPDIPYSSTSHFEDVHKCDVVWNGGICNAVLFSETNYPNMIYLKIKQGPLSSQWTNSCPVTKFISP